MKKFLIVILTLMFLSDLYAYAYGKFNWEGHEEADNILIVKVDTAKRPISNFFNALMKSPKVYFDVVHSFKGTKESNIKVPLPFNPMARTDGPRFCVTGVHDDMPVPGKYYFAFLNNGSYGNLLANLDVALICIPEYFPPAAGLSPKEVFLFEMESCLKSKNNDTVRMTLRILSDFDMWYYSWIPSETLKDFLKNQDIEVRCMALGFLLERNDADALEHFEKLIFSSVDAYEINRSWPRWNENKFKLSTKASNALLAYSDEDVKRKGSYLLMSSADISSIPFLLKALESENNDLLYNSYYCLSKLTRAGYIMPREQFKGKQKAEAMEYWRKWKNTDMENFVSDQANCNVKIRR